MRNLPSPYKSLSSLGSDPHTQGVSEVLGHVSSCTSETYFTYGGLPTAKRGTLR